MKQIVLVVIIILVAFSAGYAVRSMQSETESFSDSRVFTEKRVSGIGGIFFKSENPVELKKWYSKHLGLDTDEYGTSFEWRQAEDSTMKGFTQWSPFHMKTDYFGNDEQQFMINYRVHDLDHLLEHLTSEGVVVVDSVLVEEYGKFAHILDLEGNKVELWEPFDDEYDKIVEGRTW